jgi:WD40 repeat protein
MVFAVACSPNVIKLFDSRAHDSGPFLTFDINLTRPSPSSASSSFFSWSSLKFSPDGKDLLVTTTESDSAASQDPEKQFTNRIMLIDSYDGVEKQSYVGHEQSVANPAPSAPSSSSSSSAASLNWSSLPFEASFSPDGAFVFAGSRSGNIHSWHTATGEPVAIWNGIHSTTPITAVQFCPTKMTLVSADATGQLLWWQPTQAALTTSAAAQAQAASTSAPMNTTH